MRVSSVWGCVFLSLCGVAGKPCSWMDFTSTEESQNIYLAGRKGQPKTRPVWFALTAVSIALTAGHRTWPQPCTSLWFQNPAQMWPEGSQPFSGLPMTSDVWPLQSPRHPETPSLWLLGFPDEDRPALSANDAE